MSSFKCIYSTIFTLGPSYIRIFVKTLASNIFEYLFVKILIFRIYSHICLMRFKFFECIQIFVRTIFHIFVHPCSQFFVTKHLPTSLFVSLKIPDLVHRPTAAAVAAKNCRQMGYRPPIKNLTAHYNSQFCVSFCFCFIHEAQ